MNEIISALQKTFIFILFVIFALYFIYFISANSHYIIINLNPIKADDFASHVIRAPLWAIVLSSVALGLGIATLVAQFYLSKLSSAFDKISKENVALNDKIEKVKTNVTKCVS